MTLNYKTFLRNKVKSVQKEKKSIRTKYGLELATIEILAEQGYHDLTVETICKRSEVSRGTFYLYFDNIEAVSIHALKNFIEFYSNALTSEKVQGDVFKNIYNANLQWVKVTKANRGLFRNVFQVGEEISEISHLVNQFNDDYYDRIANNLLRYYGREGEVGYASFKMIAYCMGAMMDEMARNLYISPDKYLLSDFKKATPKNEDVAEYFSLIWYRSIYGKNPKGKELNTEVGEFLLSLK